MVPVDGSVNGGTAVIACKLVVNLSIARTIEKQDKLKSHNIRGSVDIVIRNAKALQLVPRGNSRGRH